MTKHIFTFYILLILFSACSHKAETPVEIKPIAQVKVVHPFRENMKVQQKFFGTSAYLKRNIITAPIPSFITDVYIKLGQKVKKDDLLYELETKERRALIGQSVNLDSIPKNFGYIIIKAPADGIISTLDKQQPGDYVLEGTQLCTVSESNQLVFQLNLPYEFNEIIKKHPVCEILLPDSTIIEGTMTAPLTIMNLLSQTQPYLIKPRKTIFMPENMIVSVRLTVSEHKNVQVLPEDCVLSDALMKNFWVMKLINDSTAIKVNVRNGIQQNKIIEIIAPIFSPSDRILSEGNYGLADTATVKLSDNGTGF